MTTKAKSLNIVLIGLTGCGKSTLGKMLAQKIGKDCLELDDMLVAKVGMGITEIFEKHGENYFRDREAEIVRDIADRQNTIISTGGGVVLRPENLASLKENGVIVYLKCSVEVCLQRIGDVLNRPLSAGDANMKDTLQRRHNQRAVLYESNADIVIDGDNPNAEEKVTQILAKIKELGDINILGRKKVCMVIGHPIAHSLSPQMHNAGYKALGIDDKFVYVAGDVEVEKLAIFAKVIRDRGIRGVSCTIPHKTRIMPYLDEVDQVAKNIGAVNTVVNENGVLKGYNTDWLGAVIPLEEMICLKDKRVALIGAGGAARAVAYGVVANGAKLAIFDIIRYMAEALAREYPADATVINDLSEIRQMDIIFNVSPIGMYPNVNETPVPKEFITKKHIVFDAVYNPLETMLLRQAREQGAQVIYGAEMLLHQGVAQFQLYTGHEAPVQAMREALLKHLA